MRWWLVLGTLLIAAPVLGRDNGQYAQVDQETRAWFGQLKSGSGTLCCADADGTSDPQWIGKKSADGKWRYQVNINGQWIEVPDEAVIVEPNKVGRTIVWTYQYDGQTRIRCFLPGAGF